LNIRNLAFKDRRFINADNQSVVIEKD